MKTTTNISSSLPPTTPNNMSQQQQHHPLFFFCKEQHPSQKDDPFTIKPPFLPLFPLEEEEQHDLLPLISKERHTHFFYSAATDDGTLALIEATRHDAVLWISSVSALCGFSALTTVLAVNYFDRFVTSLRFRNDNNKPPWLTQLTAVACLSLAAKMEETHVPLLLDLQVEESKFVFEAKTIQRMELLVLSTLQWRMNPVTPISFFQQLLRRFGLDNSLYLEFLCRCEQILLRVIADSRVMSYLPSTLAAAIMMHVIREIEPSNLPECRNQLLGLLQINEEQVNECYEFIMLKLLLSCDCESIHNPRKKRKCLSEPSSPGGVIDASFSCDSSNDSWAVASLLSFSMEPAFKGSKVLINNLKS